MVNSRYKALTDTGVLTVTDQDALAMMASEYGRYIEAQYQIKDGGSVVMGTNKNGSEYSMVSPYVAIASTSFKNFYNMMSRFGVSPADRQKIGAFKPEDGENDGSLSDFLEKS
jgi:P27 family predicted phage terminase small subunit